MLQDYPPGAHLLEVRAMDEDFNIDLSPARMPFRVLHPFWRQPSFYLPVLSLVFALSLAVGYALLHRRRLRLTEKRLFDSMAGELQRAHDMQMGLLPARSLKSGDFEVSGRCVPANHVGGDHYNYWLEDSGAVLAFGAADVSGKAMAAAVRAVQLSEVCHFMFPGSTDPRAALTALDGILLDRLEDSEFVTCCYGRVDLATGGLKLANAAHPFPVHYRAKDATASQIELPSLPLGVTLPAGLRKPPDYVETTIEPGDFLVVYSDGVTDTEGPQKTAFGDDRLLEAVEDAGSKTTSAEGMVRFLVEVLARHKQTASQTDDISIVAIYRAAVSSA